MGVDISSLVAGRQIELIELSGRRIAIDAFNILYQFLSIIRNRMTGEPLRDSKGRVTSHLSGLLYRTSNLLESGIKPIFVFDGKPPEFKHITIKERKAAREEAKKKWEDALARGKPAMRYAQAASKLTDEMVESAKHLLEYMGVPYIQAPSEGEMQCAYMCRSGDVWSSASQDFDTLMAGSSRLIRNLSISGKRKVPNKDVYVEVKPEMIELKDMLGNLGITQEQLVIMGILIGTDYSPGVKGVGPKNALKLVKEHGTLTRVLENVKWQSEVQAEDIFNFLLNPPVEKDYKDKLKWEDPKYDELSNFMTEEHDFSAERVQKVIERLRTAAEKGTQSSLKGWLEK
jgi:flap endonuclease-1